jgi:predicted alpha/beta superfamily hydrolase
VTLDRVFGSTPDAPPLQRTGRIDRIAARPSAHVSPREVQVWLPPGYEQDDGRRYPVLYLHDGQNVFDAAAAGAEWQVDETAQRLVLAGDVAPLIIVGVAVGDTRIQDYTPVPGRGPGSVVAGGGAAAYARYLTEELKPLIDQRFRTQPGRDSTAVGGSSLGGLVSMWLLLAHGDTFGAALVVSPSVWWADEDILKQVQARAPRRPAPRIWLDVGTEEGRGVVAGARRLQQALATAGWPSQYLEQDGAGHDEAAWATRVPQMLRFLQSARPAGR